MKDNMENFREVSNLLLKDIYVTDELKRKTLEKCTNKKFFKMNPLIASIVSAALLIATFGVHNYFLPKATIANNSTNNSIKHEYKNSVINENSKSDSKISEKTKLDNSKPVVLNNENNIGNANSTLQSKSSDTSTVTKNTNNNAEASNNISQNGIDSNKNSSSSQTKDSDTSIMDKNTDIASQNTTSTTESSNDISQNKMNDEQNEDMYLISKAPTGSASLSAPLNMASAEKYFGSEILVPNNIPEGFNLTDISIPDDKLKCIKLNYSSDSNYFELLQSKNLSELEGSKTIFIKDNKAYVSSTKDEQSNVVTTKIIWIMNNIEYSLYGNLPEDALINVAKSVN